ncbi:KOW motif-containing protein [Candidatus Karelsulcia muelleri]
MKLKTQDNILINSGNYKGKKGKIIKIIKKKNRALVKLLNHKLLEIDFSNLLLIYRPSYNSKRFDKVQNILIKMRKINNKLNYFFSIEELKNLLKIRDLENIKLRKNELFP